jgi:hypothetical protein
MRQYHYLHSGLYIQSCLEIIEWQDFSQELHSTPPDITIDINTDLSEPDFPTVYEQKFENTKYEFNMPDVGRFHVTENCISLSTYPDFDINKVRAFLLGSCMGAAYYLNGCGCLHASVVKTPIGVIAFCGPPGCGKSTLAASFVNIGYELICDDLCRFSIYGGDAYVFPSCARLKLWNDAIQGLHWNFNDMMRDHARYDKYLLPIDQIIQTKPVRLDHVYVPDWGENGIKKLIGMTALKQIVTSAIYRPDMVELMGRLPQVWEQFINLARCVSVFKLARPRDLSQLDFVRELILKTQCKADVSKSYLLETYR